MSNIKDDSSKFFKGSIWWWTRKECQAKNYYDNLFPVDTMVVVVSNDCLGNVTVLPIYSPCSNTDLKNVECNPYIVFAHVNNKDCYIYCNNLLTIPESCIRAFIGKLADDKFKLAEDMVIRYLMLTKDDIENVVSSSELFDVSKEDSTTHTHKPSNRHGRQGVPVYCDKTDTTYENVDAASKILCVSKGAIYKSINHNIPVKGMNFIR